MNSPSLDELTDFAERNARRWLIGTDNELPPTFYIATHGEPHIVVAPWRGVDEKDAALETLRELMRDKGATAYCVFDEAWVAFVPNLEEVKAINEGRAPNASARPDRYEVVVAYATDGINQKTRSWRIRRDARGHCVALDEEDLGEGGEMATAGRFANLLNPRA